MKKSEEDDDSRTHPIQIQIGQMGEHVFMRVVSTIYDVSITGKLSIEEATLLSDTINRKIKDCLDFILNAKAIN